RNQFTYSPLPILNDGLMETNETLRLTLTNVIGEFSLGAQRVATVTIYDNDLPPSVQSQVLPENAGITNLLVRRNDDGNAPIIVTYAVTGGTATSGEDFILSYGTLQFPPGFSTRQIPLAIIDDALAEGDETIELTLINSANGWTNKSYVLIQDDEKPVVLDPRFRAALGNGTSIQTIAWQTNGQVIVGYSDPFGSSLLNRLNSDGSLDAGFRSALTNRPIYDLTIQADGRILCAGDLGSRLGIMRLLPDGSADGTFAP